MNAFVEDALLVAVHARPLERAETFDLADLVAHEAEAARLAGGDVRLSREATGPWLARGDPAALSRAIANIVGNALRYGGSARIALRRGPAKMEVVVDDRGPGVPVAEREAVFQPFHRGEGSRSRETGGSGLGLAVARGIVEQHGGAIAIADAPGGGARFTVALPAAS